METVAHHDGVGGTHTVEAIVEGSEGLLNGLIQQEVNVQLDVLCRKWREGEH